MNDNTVAIREMSLTVAQSAQIFVRTAGNLDAENVLILIHGGPGLSHRYLLGLEQLTSSQLLVVNYDQRGWLLFRLSPSGRERRGKKQ